MFGSPNDSRSAFILDAAMFLAETKMAIPAEPTGNYPAPNDHRCEQMGNQVPYIGPYRVPGLGW